MRKILTLALLLIGLSAWAQTKDTEVKITIGSNVFIANIEDTQTGRDFMAKLPLTLDMQELNGNEKYCYGVSLTRSDQYCSSLAAGDLMLYSGNCVVLFYGSAGGYSYTRIGKLQSTDGLADAVGTGDINVKYEVYNANKFSKETFTLGSITLPYRKAEINHTEGVLPALVMYLHGGTSRGDDNETQLGEVAVDSICNYLTKKGIAATMIVPQCPAGGGWTTQNRKVVHDLLEKYITDGLVDESRVYVMGGSMGGTGTWCQLSYYPDFYAAAMPVAGSPQDLNATNVSKTPLYTVMGTNDNIMSIPDVDTFTSDVVTAGGIVKYDQEIGWTHANTCEWSYTTDRLDWLFSQKRDITSINSVSAIEINDKQAKGIYLINGQRLKETPATGMYIENGVKKIKY